MSVTVPCSYSRADKAVSRGHARAALVSPECWCAVAVVHWSCCAPRSITFIHRWDPLQNQLAWATFHLGNHFHILKMLSKQWIFIYFLFFCKSANWLKLGDFNYMTMFRIYYCWNVLFSINAKWKSVTAWNALSIIVYIISRILNVIIV